MSLPQTPSFQHHKYNNLIKYKPKGSFGIIATTDWSAPVPSIAILPLVRAIVHFTLHLGPGSRVP